MHIHRYFTQRVVWRYPLDRKLCGSRPVIDLSAAFVNTPGVTPGGTALVSMLLMDGPGPSPQNHSSDDPKAARSDNVPFRSNPFYGQMVSIVAACGLI